MDAVSDKRQTPRLTVEGVTGEVEKVPEVRAE